MQKITQISRAQAGEITPQIAHVAKLERMNPEELRAAVAAGRVVIPDGELLVRIGELSEGGNREGELKGFLRGVLGERLLFCSGFAHGLAPFCWKLMMLSWPAAIWIRGSTAIRQL